MINQPGNGINWKESELKRYCHKSPWLRDHTSFTEEKDFMAPAEVLTISDSYPLL